MHLDRWRAYAGILLLGMTGPAMPDPSLPAAAAQMQGTPGPGGPSGAADNSQLEEIVVTGLRASLEKSLDVKKNATVVLDSINAEELGRFPDSDVADSLEPLPGITTPRTTG